MMISGKSKEACTLALRAAQGNPDIAYEILNSGMAEGGAGEHDVYGHEDMGDDEYGDEEGSQSYAGEGDDGNNPFAALASNPNFGMIRQRIIEDPAFY